MKWTPDKPTQPGAYWYRDPLKQTTVADVRRDREWLVVFFPGNEVEEMVGNCPGEWAGPLSPPEE